MTCSPSSWVFVWNLFNFHVSNFLCLHRLISLKFQKSNFFEFQNFRLSSQSKSFQMTIIEKIWVARFDTYDWAYSFGWVTYESSIIRRWIRCSYLSILWIFFCFSNRWLQRFENLQGLFEERNAVVALVHIHRAHFRMHV